MMMEPQYSPWGKIQTCEELCPGVFSVSTASHGGIMAWLDIAKSVFSAPARKFAFRECSWLCFEEDCAATVALLELLDKKMFTAPVNAYWKPGEYEACVKDSVQHFYPNYWKYRESTLSKMKEPTGQKQSIYPKNRERGDAR